MSRPMVRYRKPPQLASLGARHAVVEASAGTGKTYVLEHLVVDLILTHGASIDQILIVTFTEKATAELGARIRRKLEELRDLGGEHPAAAGARDDECWLIDDRARQRLGDALLSFDRAAISTIHGFCQRLLTEHAFLHRRLFREEAVAEDEAFAVAFAEILRRAPAADPVVGAMLGEYLGGGGSLSKLRRAVAAAVRGTACLYPRRPSALRPAGVDAQRALAAAQALSDAPAGDVLKLALKRCKVHHSTTQSLGDKWSELREIAAQFRDPDDLPAHLATVDAFDRRRDDVFRYFFTKLDPASPEADVRLVAKLVQQFEAANPTLLAALVGRLTPAVTERLAGHKREAGRFDFQDMLTLVAEGLEGDGPRQRTLLSTLRARHRFALIDEFQDTDEVQWGIFKRIFFDSPDGHVLTVIGDPKQAIYAFRGADVHTYLAARRAIEDSGGERVFLTENFRSTEDVIAGYNAILDQTAPFFRPEGGILYDHPVSCGRPELRLCDEEGESVPGTVVFDIETEQKSLLTWQVKRALLARMAREIATLVGQGAPLRWGPRGAERPVRPGDIFVLTRTTRESREVGQALRAVGVPFAFFKQEKLFDTVEARDLLDLLRAIADPDDVTARARAFITPFFGLSLADLASCDDLDPGEPLLRQLHEWQALAEAGDFEVLFARIVEGSGITCRDLFFHDSERSLTNTLHLMEILQEEAARSRTTIRELAATLGAFITGARRPPGEGRDIQRLETDADAVQIMTIHHAKGLEAAVVFLYGGFWPGPTNDVRVLHDEEGRRVCDVGRVTPDAEAAYRAEQDDEERRVFYVALTRAKARLYLPRYPAAFKSLRGAYTFVNQRLHDLLGGFVDDELRARFIRQSIVCPGEALPTAEPASPAVLAAWSPPLGPMSPGADLRARGAARAGFLTTSYSAIKRAHAGFSPASLSDDALDDSVHVTDAPEAGLVEAAGPGAGPNGDELPRGRVTGRFLHGLLEELPFASIAGPPDWRSWAALPDVALVFERMRRRYDRSPSELPAAQRLVHATLAATVRMGEIELPGFAAAARIVREWEFLYPIPERDHPPLGSAGDDERPAFRIERGLIKGYVDLLFEHEGRIYICDWKGDWLPTWEAAVLSRHVSDNYTVQARLYTLGVVKALGLSDEAAYERRFGGVVYAFLRGLGSGDPDRGIHFERPSFAEVASWQEELGGDAFWRRIAWTA